MNADFEVFGQKFHLKTGPDEFLREDSLWRLKAIYERYLSATSLPKRGVALDIGAGFGAFAIPFATLFPDWQIWCFEPNEAAFAALYTNIAAHDLNNIVAFNVAVGAACDPLADGLLTALKTKDAEALKAMTPRAPYFQHQQKPGFIEINTPLEAQAEFTLINLPEIPANVLGALAPDLLKLTAPQNETHILAGLGGARLSYLLGETWSCINSNLIVLPDGSGPRSFLPLAGSPPLCLRHQPDVTGPKPGLDLIDPHAQDVPLAPHSHIAFIDRSHSLDVQIFGPLLELARYSGAEIVQARLKPPKRKSRLGKWLGRGATPPPTGLPFGARRAFAQETALIGADEMRMGPRIYRRDYLDHHKLWTSGDLDGQNFQVKCQNHMPELWYLDYFDEDERAI